MNYVDIDQIDVSKITLKESQHKTVPNLSFITPYYTFPDGKERKLFVKTTFLQINGTIESSGNQYNKYNNNKKVVEDNAVSKGLMIDVDHNHNTITFFEIYDLMVQQFLTNKQIELAPVQPVQPVQVLTLIKYRNFKIEPIKFKFAKNVKVINYNISKKYADNEQISGGITLEKINTMIPSKTPWKSYKKQTLVTGMVTETIIVPMTTQPKSIFATPVSEQSDETKILPKKKIYNTAKEGRFIISLFSTVNKNTHLTFNSVQVFDAEIKYKGAFIKSVLDKNEIIMEKQVVTIDL